MVNDSTGWTGQPIGCRCNRVSGNKRPYEFRVVQRIGGVGERNTASSHVREKSLEHTVGCEVIRVVERFLQLFLVRKNFGAPVHEKSHLFRLVASDDIVVGGNRPII